jgi:replicative DNA helicase
MAKQLEDKARENQQYQMELLAMIINNDDVYIKAVDFLRPGLFTGTNLLIYEAYEKLIRESKRPDPALISLTANIPLSDVLMVVTHYSGSPLQIDSLIYELFDYFAKDKLTKLGANISQQITAGTKYEDIIDIVARTLRGLELGNSSSVITMQEGVNSLIELINNNRSEKEFTGTPVGFKLVDHHMGGLHPGNLVILAGETSHGKTAFALSMMFNSAVYYNQPSAIISHEMTQNEIMSRLAAFATSINAKHILTGKLSDDQVSQFSNKVSSLVKSNIFIQGYIKRELTDNVSAIRLLVMQHKVKYVVVENAGNITVKGSHNDETRTAEISKTLKSLALELNITIILISHLSRDKDQAKKQPELSRLRHSGQLEADADIVIFVYMAKLHGHEYFPDNNEKPAAGRVETYIAKGRSYGLAKTYPDFIKELVLIKDHEDNIAEIYNANTLSPKEPF